MTQNAQYVIIIMNIIITIIVSPQIAPIIIGDILIGIAPALYKL